MENGQDGKNGQDGGKTGAGMGAAAAMLTGDDSLSHGGFADAATDAQWVTVPGSVYDAATGLGLILLTVNAEAWVLPEGGVAGRVPPPARLVVCVRGPGTVPASEAEWEPLRVAVMDACQAVYGCAPEAIGVCPCLGCSEAAMTGGCPMLIPCVAGRTRWEVANTVVKAMLIATAIQGGLTIEDAQRRVRDTLGGRANRRSVRRGRGAWN